MKLLKRRERKNDIEAALGVPCPRAEDCREAKSIVLAERSHEPLAMAAARTEAGPVLSFEPAPYADHLDAADFNCEGMGKDALEANHGAGTLPQEAGVGQKLLIADGQAISQLVESKARKG